MLGHKTCHWQVMETERFLCCDAVGIDLQKAWMRVARIEILLLLENCKPECGLLLLKSFFNKMTGD